MKMQLDILNDFPKRQLSSYLCTRKNRHLLRPNDVISDVYELYKGDDKWLYLELNVHKPF